MNIVYHLLFSNLWFYNSFLFLFFDKLDDPSSGDDDEHDSHSPIRPMRKSIIKTRAQTAARNYSKNRRKSSPPKKRLSLQLPFIDQIHV